MNLNSHIDSTLFLISVVVFVHLRFWYQQGSGSNDIRGGLGVGVKMGVGGVASIPADTWRNDNVIIASKLRNNDIVIVRRVSVVPGCWDSRARGLAQAQVHCDSKP